MAIAAQVGWSIAINTGTRRPLRARRAVPCDPVVAHWLRRSVPTSDPDGDKLTINNSTIFTITARP